MHRLFFGYSFAELVALILLLGLAFYFLNRKRTSVRRNAEDAVAGASDSLASSTKTNSVASSSSPMKTNDGESDRKKASGRKDVEHVDTGGSGSLTARTGPNSGGSSSSPTESNDGVVSSSSTLPTGNNYEVFLSFRGPDTREGFTDHLYRGLMDAGICAFRDDEELRQGEEISPDLSAAIKNSKILIPILSVNYGSSRWCLDELVQIMGRKNDDSGTIVLPIFYKVEPADVRYQKGKFGEAFRTRERRFDPTTLEKWKQALVKVCSLKAWEAKGYEGELVKLVVQQVLFELKKKFELVIPENLVGIDIHAKKVMEFVENNSHATLFIGIHGMGGIGKTTLAKTIYNDLSNRFEHRSFIADVRESCKGERLHCLQNQLIFDVLKQKNQLSNKDEGIKFIPSRFEGKKVLILFDDVGDDHQLKALAGNHNWFSSGSMIIITTRNKSILDNAKVDYGYELEEMDVKTSSILFSRHAFRKDAPPSEFEALTHDVVSATGGLPLSLEVLGSFLCNKEIAVWQDTIKKLMNVPHKEVQEKLMISYDALDYAQQQIFLDIACFFIGTDERIASYMWDACGFFPKEGIVVLRLMSLIKIGEDHELRMHDQLRDLGREIVRVEGKREPQKCSRLWDSKEVLEVLKEDEVTEKIEAICLSEDSSIEEGDNIVLTGKQLKNLRNLRFLDVRGANFSGDLKNSMKKLKWLQWENCPSIFEARNFHVEELRVLELWEPATFDKWQGWSWIKMAKKLKYLDLSYCESLEETICVSSLENLEVLILSGCCELKQIDSSIGNMKSLVRLDLTKCKGLEGLPTEVGRLKALEQLLLRFCSHISSLPDSIGDLQNLEILDISHTGIKELPDGIGRLRKLRDLDATCCFELGGDMPESICNLSSLQRLDLCGCYKLRSLSMLPSSLKYLRVNCQSPTLPSLSNLTRLKELYLDGCKFLECIGDHPSTLLEKSPITPFELEILHIHMCRLMITLDVSQFNHLRALTANRCTDLLEIRGLDQLKYLESLDIDCCYSIERLDLPKSEGLKKLSVGTCYKLVEIHSIDKLDFLKELNISDCILIERLNLSKFENLQILNVTDCRNLIEIQSSDRLESLKEIDISGCNKIARLDLAKSEGLEILKAAHCTNLIEIQSPHRLESLKEIDIRECGKIARLDLPKSEGLKIFNAEYCGKLIKIPCLDKFEYLEKLNMRGCPSFGSLLDLRCFDTLHDLAINCCDNLDDIRSLKIFPSLTTLCIGEYNKSLAKFPTFRHLWSLTLSNCHELREILGLEELTSLKEISFCGCSSMEILPDLSSCTNLESLDMEDCEKLTELRGLEKLENVRILKISRCGSLKTIPELDISGEMASLQEISFSKCSSIEIFPDFSSCTNLRRLNVQNCKKLTELRGLEKLQKLEQLWISECESLKTILELDIFGEMASLELIYFGRCSSIEILPDLSSFTNLRILYVYDCKKLTELRGLEKLEKLSKLDIQGCESLKRIPKLCGRRVYFELVLEEEEEKKWDISWMGYGQLFVPHRLERESWASSL